MCGIAGVIKFGNRPILPYQVTFMANGLQYRGNDATGVAVMYENGETNWYKNNIPAWKFTSSDEYEKWVKEAVEDRPDTKIVLVHTRKATKGTPFKSENNHPLVGKGNSTGGMIIHNGMIGNDDILFQAKGWKRYAETDSDVIRAILDAHEGVDEDIIEEMSQLSGVAAIAAVHPNTPDKLLLLRDSNPVMIGGTDDFFAFASDKKVVFQVLTPWVKRFGIPMRVHSPNISFVPMANESGWIVSTKTGLEHHAKFQCNGFSGRGNTRYSLGTDYHERQERFLREAAAKSTTVRETHYSPTVNPTRSYHTPTHNHGRTDGTLLPNYVICPNYKCNKHIRLTETQRDLSLSRLSCMACDTSLTNALDAAVPLPS